MGFICCNISCLPFRVISRKKSLPFRANVELEYLPFRVFCVIMGLTSAYYFIGGKLYFYSRSDTDNRENHMEIDFLITEGKKIAPIEVKSSNYTSHSSLDKFRNKFSSKIGNSYILYSKDVMIKDGIIHLPFYMAMFL